MGSNDKALKKLARSGWRQGKEYKKESNRNIRNTDHNDSEDYSFEDARLELQGLEGSYIIIDELSNNPVIQKLTPPKLPKSVEKEIKRHLDNVKHAIKLASIYRVKPEELGKVCVESFGRFIMSAEQRYRRAMLELPKYLEREDLPNKLRKRINEALR